MVGLVQSPGQLLSAYLNGLWRFCVHKAAFSRSGAERMRSRDGLTVIGAETKRLFEGKRARFWPGIPLKTGLHDDAAKGSVWSGLKAD